MNKVTIWMPKEAKLRVFILENSENMHALFENKWDKSYN